ncbi:trace amine-associated receptor 7e-like [Acropora millepora]|uniref:trace amine-associated receptor 7e-like n=1 Tax=Acropora millepora TaxID=45264 RepID=UPI001CF16C87|nr:trace amine-associated receptor 7e-like [Acropora millepora]
MANHSQQQNATSFCPFFFTSDFIAWLSVFGMEAVAIVTINALTIIVYVKERSLRKRSMYLVINQAVADMFVGVSMLIECWYWGMYCDLWTINPFSILFFVLEFLRIVFPTASIINLAAISLERTHATFLPLKHRLIKKKIFEAVVSIVWITAGLISTSFVSQLFEEHISVVLQASLFLFCLLVIVVSYSSISIKIVCGNQPHRHGGTSRERKLTKTLFIVTAVSLLLTLPNIILRTYAFYAFLTLQMISVRTYALLDCFFLLLFYANTLVNPAFYTLRMPEFRKALFSFFNCRSQLQLSA